LAPSGKAGGQRDLRIALSPAWRADQVVRKVAVEIARAVQQATRCAECGRAMILGEPAALTFCTSAVLPDSGLIGVGKNPPASAWKRTAGDFLFLTSTSRRGDEIWPWERPQPKWCRRPEPVTGTSRHGYGAGKIIVDCPTLGRRACDPEVKAVCDKHHDIGAGPLRASWTPLQLVLAGVPNSHP